jgi:bifunctional UDP-N-acetylglucosamine pyrophosphorylase/glucosamine-1-phosphate N-acetyltransferase
MLSVVVEKSLMKKRVAVLLAAGVSKRMNTRLPKVLHEVTGRPMLAYVLDACRSAGVEKIYVVVGFGGDEVRERFADAKDIVWVKQPKQLGTAHAVKCCKEHLQDFKGNTLVLCGDGPLIRAATLKTLVEKHDNEQSAATLATAVLEDPTGYGRIARDAYGNIQGIIEHSDCTPQQLAITEVNPSYYLFDNQLLFNTLDRVKPNNAKNEYYLTDALSLLISGGHKVIAVTAVRPEEAMSVNSRAQLSVVSKIMQNRIQQELMESGVTIVDPENTWIDARAKVGQDTVIEPFTYIHGEVKIGAGCRIGPFAYLRNGTVIGDDVVVGVFTEIKNSSLADGVRARHHSYLGDAIIGRNVNVGAGLITANFDGRNINKTTVGDDCYIGSGAVLVAPLVLEAGEQIPAGAVVSQDNVGVLKGGQKTGK